MAPGGCRPSLLVRETTGRRPPPGMRGAGNRIDRATPGQPGQPVGIHLSPAWRGWYNLPPKAGGAGFHYKMQFQAIPFPKIVPAWDEELSAIFSQE